MRPDLAPAFTLTEMLVVLALLGVMVGLVALAAPDTFARAALQHSASALVSDLDRAALNARREAAYGELSITPRAYTITIGSQPLLTRALPRRVRLRASATTFAIDPAGRFAAGEITLESEHDTLNFTIDAITGRVSRSGPGSGRNPRRRRDRRNGRDTVLIGIARHAQRPQPRAYASGGNGASAITVGSGAERVAGDGARGRVRGLLLVARLRARSFLRQFKARTLELFGRGRAAQRIHQQSPELQRSMGAAARSPAFTLMELLVALVILGLIAGLVSTSLTPWIALSRHSSEQASFINALASAELTIDELAAGAINADQDAAITQRRVQFATYVPRLSPTPLHIALTIEQRNNASSLVLRVSEIEARPTTLLESHEPLRFAVNGAAASGFRVEARAHDVWSPVLIARFYTSAAFTCAVASAAGQCQ